MFEIIINRWTWRSRLVYGDYLGGMFYFLVRVVDNW